MVEKWYDSPELDKNQYISSRIRLARNIRKYPFPTTQTEASAIKVIEETRAALLRGGEDFFGTFELIDIDSKSEIDKFAYVNRHAISPEFFKHDGPKALFLRDDEKISIMVNEEDHLRLQTIFGGDNIDRVWDMITRVDDVLEKSIEYAFDRTFGYLTSCPTNIGTGIRASYMLHLPMLEATGEFAKLAPDIGKFGMTVRGIYGEGTEPMGSIYQISNQTTTGKSEQEIIKNLKGITSKIVEKEVYITKKMIEQNRSELEDRTYRAYGILTHARKLTLKESVQLLSQVRFGFVSGLLCVKRPAQNIYSILMNVQNALMQHNCGRTLHENEAEVLRSEYIRNCLIHIPV
ncbi:protein-arginine kinase [Clostridia bacterium]|nr:protein-arginine kinase [Clostridia bacterium]